MSEKAKLKVKVKRQKTKVRSDFSDDYCLLIQMFNFMTILVCRNFARFGSGRVGEFSGFFVGVRAWFDDIGYADFVFRYFGYDQI